MNHSNNSHSKNSNQFDANGNRKTDLSDGLTITALMILVITGVIFYLYSM